MNRGGACGVCVQKTGEAEILVAGGITDVMISNQVTAPAKIERVAALTEKARILICADDAENIAALSAAMAGRNTSLEVLVEIDVGNERCGVKPSAALALAKQIDAAAGSGVYNELQCGSYIFMDADYGRVRSDGNAPLGFQNALFVLTSIMSVAGERHAVCDAGHKAASIDSGFPVVQGRNDLEYNDASDEHGVIADPSKSLHLNEKLRLIPGHCDPTVNLHDQIIAVRGEKVEAVWPVSARGVGT